MMHRSISHRLPCTPSLTATAFLALLGALFLWPSSTAQAQGSIAACGDIRVEASAQCEVQVQGGCQAQCTPLQCSASLYADCQGSCSLDAQAACSARCDIAGCQAECEVDPGRFDCSAQCSAQCNADCSGQCQARCQAGGNQASCQAECEASCSASCDGECQARCEVEPPQASCQARCQASCDGQCRAEANFDCQVDCQAGGYAGCTGSCEAACQSPEGALFCDRQFVDHGGNLRQCIQSLNAVLDVEVDASASAACSGGRCSAQAEASAGCAAVPSTARTRSAFGAGVLLALGLLWRRRRRVQGVRSCASCAKPTCPLQALTDSGRLKPARRSLDEVPDAVRLPADAPTLSAALAEGRTAER
ncbi:MAG: hypothetical protein ACPGUV_01370 [Polyangiales bacterium]